MPTKPIDADVDAAVASPASGIHRVDLLAALLKALLAWLGALAGKDKVAPSDLAAGSGAGLLGYLPSGAGAAIAVGGGLALDSGGTLSATGSRLALTAVKVGPAAYNAAINEEVQVDPTGGTFNVRLPDKPARATKVKLVDVSASRASVLFPVTVLPWAGPTTVDSAASFLLQNGTQSAFIYDEVGDNWVVDERTTGGVSDAPTDGRHFSRQNGGWSSIEGLVGSALQGWSAMLDAVTGLGTAGFVARTGSGTAAARSIAVASGRLSVANPDGVAGNPTLDVVLGTTAGTVAAGDDSRILGVMQKSLNGSDFIDPRAVRTNLGLRLARDVVPATDSWTDPDIGTAPPVSATYMFARNVSTGQNYFSKAPDTVCPTNYAASTTKQCTVLLLLREKGLVLDTEFATVLAGETVGGDTAGLLVGDVVSLRDLLYGALLPSGNDACEVIARVVGTYIFTRTGSGTTGRVRFLAEMNLLATQLGMTNTSYGSPHGIQFTPSGANNSVNTTTARDLARLATAAQTNPVIGPVMVTTSHLMTITGANARTYTIDHGPGFAFFPTDGSGPYDGVIGGKGGTFSPSYSYSTLWRAPNGHMLILVVITAPNSGDKILDITAMYYEAICQFGLSGRRDTDASYASTVLLVGANTVIVDSSPVARALTNTAATLSSVNAIIGFGSINLNGSTSHIDAADSADFAFGSGDWTIEFWWRGTGSVPGAGVVFVSQWDTTSNQRGWTVQFDPTVPTLQVFVSTTGSDFPTAKYDLASFQMSSAALWNGGIRHVLVRRSGTDISIYLNGIKGNTSVAISTTALFDSTSKMMMGARQLGAGITLPVAAILDELRITKGVARRTAVKFTPIPRTLSRA